MTLDDALKELRRRNEPVPRPARLPTAAEVSSTELKLGVKFHSDYRRFLQEVSDVNYSVLEPATITVPEAHNSLFKITGDAWGAWRVAQDLLPFCEDNADFYCMTSDGRVVFWSHEMNGPSGEEWPDLASWIEQVWMLNYDSS
jgi:hypothetical protein